MLSINKSRIRLIRMNKIKQKAEYIISVPTSLLQYIYLHYHYCTALPLVSRTAMVGLGLFTLDLVLCTKYTDRLRLQTEPLPTPR